MAGKSMLAALTLAVTLLRAGPVLPAPARPPVQVVLFTHIEDNTPGGILGTAANRAAYQALRARLLEMGALARLHGAQWSLQPDWKMLLAARLYEGENAARDTVNFLAFLRDNLGVAIDPHSHEGGGYNYTDVAYLLETLEVGGSTVIGGHVWDPSYPQFQEWERFRVPVRGLRYPAALWRGDILMGSGTPNHVNDPIVSGVWRPRDRYDYWTDDRAGNIAAVGAFRGDVAGITSLVDAYRTGEVDPACMLTASVHIRPVELLAPGGLAAVEASVIRPLVALRDAGEVVLTDFTSLVATWRQGFGASACLYAPEGLP